MDTGDRLLTPGEVAALFRVDPKTVTRWAAAGRIGSIRTPGGHRRFRESEVRALLEGEGMLDEIDESAVQRPTGTSPATPAGPGPATPAGPGYTPGAGTASPAGMY
ncbi:BldC family transcriptional regulator [Micromonospora sp. NPDC003197]